MKKIIILSLLILPAFAYEEVPLLIDTSAINIELKEDDNTLINTNNVKKMKDTSKIPNNTKIKLDAFQISPKRQFFQLFEPFLENSHWHIDFLLLKYIK